MAHSLSAKKRVRQNLKRNARNRARKDVIKDDVRAFGKVLAAGDFTAAAEALRKVSSRIDKVAAKKTIHKNAAARKRSRLAKRLNAAKAAGATTGAGTKAGQA